MADKKNMNFPSDPTGDALREMAESGLDMSKEYEIEFFTMFAAEDHAQAMYDELLEKEINAELSVYEEEQEWEVAAIIEMVPTYENITQMDKMLSEIAEEFEGVSDGWGVLEEE